MWNPFGSAFWGPSDAQQDAEGYFPAQGHWNTEQYQNWLARSNQNQQNAEAWTPWAVNYFQNVGTHGFGTPDDVRNWGNWIMPGTQQVTDSRRNRLNQIGADFDATFSGAQGRSDDIARGIGQNYDIIQGDINGTFGRMGGRADTAHNNILGNIGQTYGGARQGVLDTYSGLRGTAGNTYSDMLDSTAGLYDGLQGRSTGRFGELGGRAGDVYGGMRSDSESTFGGLRSGNEQAFNTAERTLQQLNPAGDASAARTARSFAPQIASTMGRLRAAGIDPNSPEAASLLGRVETARSRATDDAYADHARDFVDRSTALTLGREGINRSLGLAGLENRQGLGMREEEIQRGLGLGEMQNYQNLGRELGGIGRGLVTDRLMNDQGLAQNQLGMDTNLLLQGGRDTRNELTRNLNMGQDLDLNWLNQTTGNRNNAFNQSWDWNNQRNNLDLQGWNTRAGLGREQNAEDFWGYNLNTIAPWQAGMDWMNNQNRVQSNAAGTVLNAGNAAANQAMGAANVARGFGNDAAQNFGQTIGIEAPNAGYGLKAIMSAIGGMASGGMGGNPWGGSYGGNGGFGSQNPWIYSMGG
jgi:hypothetical protein